MNCPECHDLLLRRLDGEVTAADARLREHLARCPECRAAHASVVRLEEGLRLLGTAPPPCLANQITTRVLWDRQLRRLQRRGLALAASVLLALVTGYYAWRDTGLPVAAPQWVEAVPTPAPAVSLQQSVEDASSAVMALTRRTADVTVDQTRWLLAEVVPAPPAADPRVLEETLEPPARSLREAGQGVTAALEPMATSARRAISLFLRESPTETSKTGS